MTEFANRIDTQRLILKSVNSVNWPVEPLLSLTQKSINRWSKENSLSDNCRLVDLVTEASRKLFFLANKSQEQITIEYAELSGAVTKLHADIKSEISNTYK